jgi:hypothetical protein
MRITVLGIVATALVAAFAGTANAQQPVSPAVAPGVAGPAESGAPALRQIPIADLAGLFKIDPKTSRPAQSYLRLVGAFEVAETRDAHLVDAWSPGYLPVTLKFSDGRCFSLTADYYSSAVKSGTLSNARLVPISCDHPTPHARPAAQPSDPALRYIGSAWGYGAWADDRTGTTIVSVPFTETFEPLFTTRMSVSTILALNGVDTPSGDVTLVGRIDGRLTIVTLEVGY